MSKAKIEDEITSEVTEENEYIETKGLIFA